MHFGEMLLLQHETPCVKLCVTQKPAFITAVVHAAAVTASSQNVLLFASVH